MGCGVSERRDSPRVAELKAALAARLGLSEAQAVEAALTMLLRHVDRIDSRVPGRVRDSAERVIAARKANEPIKLRTWHAGDTRAFQALLERVKGDGDAK